MIETSETGSGGWPNRILRGTIKKVLIQPTAVWNPDREVTLSKDALEDLRWWRQNMRKRIGVPLHLGREHEGRWKRPRAFGTDAEVDRTSFTLGGVPVITSDAAAEGEGANRMAKGGWWCCGSSWTIDFTHEQREEHITTLELRTAVWAIKTVGKPLKRGEDGRVLLRIDNQAAKGILNKGASSSPVLNSIVADLADWCWEQGVEVHARYIRSEDNRWADALSRGTARPDSKVFVLSRKQLEQQGERWEYIWPGAVEDPVDWTLGRVMKGWREMLQTTETDMLFSPPWTEVEECLETSLRGSSKRRAIAIFVPCLHSMVTKHWWIQGRSKVSTIVDYQGEVWGLPAKRNSREPVGIGEPRLVKRQGQLQIWTVNRK